MLCGSSVGDAPLDRSTPSKETLMLTKRFAALGLAATLALPLAAACSKSETTTSSGTNASSTSTSTSTTSGGTSGGSGRGGGTPSTGDCVKAAQQWSAVILSATSAIVPGQEVDTAKLQAQVDEIKGSVPTELQADMQTWADGYSAYLANIKDLDLSDPSNLVNPATAQKLQDASKPIETPEFKQAQSNLQDYFDKCSSSTPSISLPS
jgi:hypothetical protein